jgi:hypothetical protein
MPAHNREAKIAELNAEFDWCVDWHKRLLVDPDAFLKELDRREAAEVERKVRRLSRGNGRNPA